MPAAPAQPAFDESQFAAVFEDAAIGMALLAPGSRVLRANRALCEMLGYAQAQLLACDAATLLHPEDQAADAAERAQLLDRQKHSYQREQRYLHRGGRTVWAHAACSLMRDGAGQPQHFIVQIQDISERKLAEQALQGSEERFRSLSRLSSDWYWELDEHFRCVVSSGIRADAWDPDFQRTTLEAHLPFRDVEYRRSDGKREPRYYSISGEPVFAPCGRFTGYRGTARDITDSKLAERRLRKTQSLLHMAAQIGRLGAWTYEPEQGHVIWSEEVCAIHEVPRGFQPTPEKSLEFYAPNYRAPMRRLLKTCLRDGTPFDVETQVVTAKGRLIWVRIIAEAEWDTLGRVKRLMGACQDISESKQAAEEAYAMAEQLTTTLESLTDAFFTVDREWRFTYINAEAERMMRRPRAALLGRKMADEFEDLRNSEFSPHFQRAVAENVAVQFEIYYPPFDIWVQVRAFPSRQGLAVYIKDVTEHRKAQQEILRLNADLEQRVEQRTQQLEAANAELEAFSYSIAHDLRAPLGSIDGFSLALERSAGEHLGGRAQHYLQRIRAGVRKMGELTDGLLALTRLSRAELRREAVDLAAIARGVAAQLRERWPGRAIDIVIPARLAATGDVILIEQLLQQLLANAWKFSAGAVRARVELGTGKPGVYFVRDNGTGFDMAYASRLFQLFHRLHSVSEFEGSGVGLAIAHKIVTRHGGRIWAESAPGRGACFYFTLVDTVK